MKALRAYHVEMIPTAYVIDAAGRVAAPNPDDLEAAVGSAVRGGRDADIQVDGSGQLFGWIIGRTLRVTAHGGIHFDESLVGRAGSVASIR